MEPNRQLILFYCSGTKCRSGRETLPLPTQSVSENLGSDARDLLQGGRRAARQVPGTVFDDNAPETPALTLYIGLLYQAPGFYSVVESAVAEGVHCLIVSGGYGLVRAEELIRWYDAKMDQTADVWRPRLGRILQDYVERNKIERVFAAISGTYAKVIKESWTDNAEYFRHVPTRDYGRDYGRAIVSLIQARLNPGRSWQRVS